MPAPYRLHNNTLGALRDEARSVLATRDKAQDLDYLLCYSLKRPRGWLYAHPEYRLQALEKDALENSLQAYLNGMPLAQIRSGCEFYSLHFAVTAEVLIPRPETELLVEQALLFDAKKVSVLDLGTGCGNIACALQTQRPGWNILASDISDAALQLAQSNAKYHDLDNIQFRLSDWFSDIRETFDLIVSNPPYIDESDCDLEESVRCYEPALALFAPQHGLGYLQRIIEQAPQHLHSKGQLMVEHGHRQSDAVCALFKAAGFVAIQPIRDHAGQWRAAMGSQA